MQVHALRLDTKAAQEMGIVQIYPGARDETA